MIFVCYIAHKRYVRHRSVIFPYLFLSCSNVLPYWAILLLVDTTYYTYYNNKYSYNCVHNRGTFCLLLLNDIFLIQAFPLTFVLSMCVRCYKCYKCGVLYYIRTTYIHYTSSGICLPTILFNHPFAYHIIVYVIEYNHFFSFSPCLHTKLLVFSWVVPVYTVLLQVYGKR